MSQDVYLRLREFLDRLPGGFPATDSGVEIRILKKLFTLADAEFVMKLEPRPATAGEIAKRLGTAEAKATEKLESLAKRGLIFRLREKEKTQYQPFQFIVGIYEFQLKSMDREFAEMMEEYFPYLGMAFAPLKTKQLRVAPVESAVDAAPKVAPYNRIRDLVKKQSLIVMAQCICRKEQGLLGHKCDRPSELCFSFGQFGQYVLDNGMGKRVSSDEAMKLLDLAEESALVLSPSNTQELAFICCCCGCCCGALRRLKLLDNPADYFQSYYRAVIDPEACTACGTCMERCQIDAIEERDDVMEVNPARCIGCGLCVSTCPAEAIKLEEKPGSEAPPADMNEVLERLAAERGLK
ncbi:MAG: 4Fe-4S binding protein [Candidatus Lindowbacteria bacterium]|nr:4Fe-4S binding protein [Candidatus Lindowbacteria bacterium]